MFVCLPKQVEGKYHKIIKHRGNIQKLINQINNLMQQLLPNKLTKCEYGNQMLQISILPVNK